MLATIMICMAVWLSPSQQTTGSLFDAFKAAIQFATADAGPRMQQSVLVDIPSFIGMADSLSVALPNAKALAGFAGERGKALLRPDSIKTCHTVKSQTPFPDATFCTPPDGVTLVQAYRLLKHDDGTVTVLISVASAFGSGDRRRLSGPTYSLVLQQNGDHFEVLSLRKFLK
jgi:hypothetical protein